jgi:CheY-like chemotaxis protein
MDYDYGFNPGVPYIYRFCSCLHLSDDKTNFSQSDDSANAHMRKANNVTKVILYMAANELQVLLADDDIDDCLLFKEALKELPISTHLTIVNDGDQLMKLLRKSTSQLPHVLFLDINMPRKNGFECLTEIKLNDKLKALPVILYSTTSEQDVIDRLYQSGAQYFIRKQFEFLKFTRVIHYSLTLIMQGAGLQRTKNNFILTGEKDLVNTEIN